MSTFLLDDNWDLTLKYGQLELVGGNYEIAQNVSNAIRLFTRDAFFNQADGIPHFENELGSRPNPALIIDRIQKQAKAVQGVLKARAILTSEITTTDRNLEGICYVDTINGDVIEITFNN